jgi:sugar phosphate isomerase/epimerase
MEAEELRTTDASISTMWALQNYPDLNDFISVAKKTGFQYIELNHQINSEMLSNVNFDHTQFSSVHEPCPADISTKELVERDWLISSHNEASRKKGVDAVKRSIRLAHEINAPVVVMHCGTVNPDMQLENKLRSLFRADNTRTEEYLVTKTQFAQLRSELAANRLQAVKMSLLELMDYADRYEIKLGLENRYHYMDIPSIDEMGELLALGDAAHLGFIYDVGHAQSLDRLGYYHHEDWLNRYSSRILGAHLHDVIGLTDHFAPGLGEIDFKLIAKYLPENSFRTFELLPGNTLAQIQDGLRHLVNAGCIHYI